MDTSIITEPILLTPRLDAKPWGGTNLSRFGVDLHGESAVGEAVLTSTDVTVKSGRHAGKTLGELIALNPLKLLGRHGVGLGGPNRDFPLLAKLIDATAPLSIQVHPTNEIAPDGEMGKTEAWYVLAANPGSTIMAGLKPGIEKADVEAAMRSGESIEQLVSHFEVEPGDVLFLPAGTIHALGAGIVIYEIQQPSFVTYRLQDWGRNRELHIDSGLTALKPDLRPVPQKPLIRTTDSHPVPAVQCQHFALEVLQIGAAQAIILAPDVGPQVFTTIAGKAELSASQSDVAMPIGSTAVLFANAGPARVSSLTGARVLRAWTNG